MNKKRILLVIRIIILLTVIVGGSFAWHFWSDQMPMKATLCGMSAAIIVFNLVIAIFLVNKTIRR